MAGITCAITMLVLMGFVSYSTRMLEVGGKVWDEATVTVTDYAVHITFSDSQIQTWKQQALNDEQNEVEGETIGMKMKSHLMNQINKYINQERSGKRKWMVTAGEVVYQNAEVVKILQDRGRYIRARDEKNSILVSK
jgi:hypothetical protein